MRRFVVALLEALLHTPPEPRWTRYPGDDPQAFTPTDRNERTR